MLNPMFTSFSHSCVSSVNNSWTRDTGGAMRLPIMANDPNSPGNILYRFVFEKMSPGQTRLHCQPATNAQLNAFKTWKPTAIYSPSLPLGHNTIRDRFLTAGVILGLEKPLKGHALRRLAITKMARGGVQLTEIMATARHSSIAASAAYMGRTDKSQVTKLKALGVNMDGALKMP